MISLQGIMNDIIAGQEREERAITSWHISKIGSCPTGTYLERMGVEPDSEFDDRTLRLFDCGNMFENWIVEQASEYAIKNGMEVVTQERVEDKELGISGRLDLMMINGEEKMVFEIKSKHSKSFWYMQKKGEGAHRHHMYQLWLYLKILNLPVGSIYYVSRDDLCHLEYPVYLANEEIEKEVMAELTILNKAWKTKTPPPCLIEDKDWRARYCRWHSKCKEYKP